MRLRELIYENEIASTTEIFVDMDGVLADFFTEWKKLIGQGWRDITDIKPALQKIRDTENFWLDLPMTANAQNLLNLIKDVRGEYNILSSPLPDDPNSEPHKREWIENNLNFFPPKRVIITHDKARYATQRDGTPNILIDDYGVNIRNWEGAGGVGFKYKDHKFERTADAIKQHIQEPVEENFAESVDLVENPLIIIAILARTAAPELSKRGLQWLHRVVQKNFKQPLKATEKEAQQIDKVLTKMENAQRKADRFNANVRAGEHMDQGKAEAAEKIVHLGKQEIAKILKGIEKTIESIDENFADGKKKGKSRPGRVKKAGASCKGSVTSLRKKAKKYSGERGKMYHWCANMKSGRNK